MESLEFTDVIDITGFILEMQTEFNEDVNSYNSSSVKSIVESLRISCEGALLAVLLKNKELLPLIHINDKESFVDFFKGNITDPNFLAVVRAFGMNANDYVAIHYLLPMSVNFDRVYKRFQNS